jgi:hypothetical protein|tara:strand:- start:434 stop:886 length:453 start_codon:yes stop_codon:yes gene_type:complete
MAESPHVREVKDVLLTLAEDILSALEAAEGNGRAYFPELQQKYGFAWRDIDSFVGSERLNREMGRQNPNHRAGVEDGRVVMEPLLDVKAAAQEIGVSPSTLRVWISLDKRSERADDLPFRETKFNRGRKWLVDRDDLMEWHRKRKASGGA